MPDRGLPPRQYLHRAKQLVPFFRGAPRHTRRDRIDDLARALHALDEPGGRDHEELRCDVSAERARSRRLEEISRELNAEILAVVEAAHGPIARELLCDESAAGLPAAKMWRLWTLFSDLIMPAVEHIADMARMEGRIQGRDQERAACLARHEEQAATSPNGVWSRCLDFAP